MDGEPKLDDEGEQVFLPYGFTESTAQGGDKPSPLLKAMTEQQTNWQEAWRVAGHGALGRSHCVEES